MAKVQIFTDSIIQSELINPKLHKRVYELLGRYIAMDKNNVISNAGGFQTPPIKCNYILDVLSEKAGAIINENYSLKKKTIIKVSAAWINRNDKYNFNMPHVHTTNFSGIYYLQTPKENGHLVFMKNDASEDFCGNNQFIDKEFFSRWRVIPKQNEFILFPGNFTHLVEAHYEDTPRISVAFNVSLSYG